jgi:hypothetical protein
LVKKGEEMFFKKLNKGNKTDDKINRLESELKKTKDELKDLIDSRFLEIKYPDGVIEQLYLSFGIFTINTYPRENVFFKYSDGAKVIKIPITYFKDVITEYKILVNENTVYVGVKSEYEEEYFVVDKHTSSVIKINYDSISELEKRDWIKNI